MTLLSMTGFGSARHEDPELAVSVEIRTINGRHLKLNVRSTDGFSALDSRIEALVRQAICRGTVHVGVRIRRLGGGEDYRLNGAVLESYLNQLQAIAAKRHLSEGLRLELVAALPGVVEQLRDGIDDADELWPIVEGVVAEALGNLDVMRKAEGAALAADLTNQCTAVATALSRIAARAPVVAENYRFRLQERVNDALKEVGVTVQASDLVRETCLFADRCDVAEEVVRLRSHLEQFADTLARDVQAGRKLEFICQEMGREANTIGSKANDAEISLAVVDVKTALERIREQIQNVE